MINSDCFQTFFRGLRCLEVLSNTFLAAAELHVVRDGSDLVSPALLLLLRLLVLLLHDGLLGCLDGFSASLKKLGPQDRLAHVPPLIREQKMGL